VVPEDFPFEWMNMEDDSSIYDAFLMMAPPARSLTKTLMDVNVVNRHKPPILAPIPPIKMVMTWGWFFSKLGKNHMF
jgi:hypothetical protein